jgi:hypothetical protein
MLNLISIGVGGVALILALVAFFPLLGWANWFIVPLAMIGLALGVLSRSTTGRNLNIVVIAICVIRLMLGGGLF